MFDMDQVLTQKSNIFKKNKFTNKTNRPKRKF